MLQGLRKGILLFSILLSCYCVIAQIDLELSISTDNTEIAQWENGTFTLRLENKGTANATGISVRLVLDSDEMILVGGSQAVASSGTYNQSIWNDISVPVDGVATLELQLFSKVPELTLFAEVIAADQSDSDSTPNNGIANEDDEAHFPSRNTNGLIDLELDVKLIGSTYINPILEYEYGGAVAFGIIARNSGATDATGVNIQIRLPEAEASHYFLDASSGEYNDGVWSNVSIPANESAILHLVITKRDPNFILFAEVMAADQADIDSTPSSGICCSAREDDELSFPKEAPDLEIVDISCPAQFPKPNSELTFNITIRNTGTFASEASPLGFFRKVDGSHRIEYELSKYDEQIVPSIPAGETRVFSLNYAYNTNEVIFENFRVNFESGNEDKPFFSFHTWGALRQFPVDLFCKKVNTDIELRMTTENDTYTQNQIVKYSLQVTNKGNEDAYNLQVYIADTYNGDVLEATSTLEGSYFLSDGRYVERYWKINKLAAGESATLEVVYRRKSNIGSFQLYFNVTSPHLIDPIITNNNISPQTFTRIGGCPSVPSRLVFESQDSIERFRWDYFDCSRFSEIVISGSDITSLKGLEQLASVGKLTIENTSLRNLEGLEQVYFTPYRELTIRNNDLLTTLNLDKALSLSKLLIEENDRLVNLEGLNNLSIVSELSIQDNDALVSLQGLENLAQVSSRFTIVNNGVLGSLAALEQMEWTYDYLRYSIQSNPQLSVCDIPTLCYYIEQDLGRNGSKIIANNAFGCNSTEEVEQACNSDNAPLADLTLRNNTAPNQMPQGEDVRFNLSIDNIGQANAAGEIRVGFYLSEDATWDENDRLIGNIQTGYLGIGSHPAGGLVNIPPHLPSGSYYFITVVDVGDTIQESNEENNVLSQALLVGNTNDGIDIELNISTPNPNVEQWKAFPVTVNIQNRGVAAASDIVVNLGLCSLTDSRTLFYREGGIVYANTNYEATLGSYKNLSQNWEIPVLEAGQSATLQLDLYNLSNLPVRIFALTLAYGGNDIDSSPGYFSNSTCLPNEDDESIININAGDAIINGANNAPNEYLHIYPNPTSNLLEIKGVYETSNLFRIYNIHGQCVQQGQLNEGIISVQNLANGVYYLEFSQKRNQTIRFMKID